MTAPRTVQLGCIQETMLVPLYLRAVESRSSHPILRDPKAAEMVDSIDWDFRRFGQPTRVLGCALRCAIFDGFAQAFMARHPGGTVVEVGAGLNTRFERLDNGTVHWFDLDLPDVVEQRRRFFVDTARRRTLACSVLDPAWVAHVRQSPGPYCFLAETVLVYLVEEQVRSALSLIASSFPGASVALDTTTRMAVERANRDHASRNLDARFAWPCEDPRAVEDWGIGLRLVETHSVVDAARALRSRLSWRRRALFWVLGWALPPLGRAYRMNLFTVEDGQHAAR
jgi:O-methyltransferase involved in polyketide biosynthesis